MSFTPYQVDYSVKNASKTFGFSKKRVSFKFGIANPEAVSQGLTGAHCRGSEHEVIFIWSLNSGKRQILADGKDVHYSETGQNGWTTDQVFQHHFSIRVPNYSVPFRCHLITQPANKDVPSIHPFELRVNGASFFSFCKIYQLGTPQMVSRPLKGSRGQVIHGTTHMNPEDDPYCTPEERKAIAAAKLASLREMRGGGDSTSQQSSTMNRDEGNLINLLDDPIPAAPPAAPVPSQFVSSMTMDTTFGAGAPPAPAPASYGQQPYSNYSLGAPPPAVPPAPAAPFGAPPPAAGYGQPPLPPAPAPAYGQPPMPPNAMTAYQQPPAPQGYGMPPAFATPPPNPGGLMSPTGQSVASYGSAPSFAQPPRQTPPPQQYQGYPQY